MAVDAGPAPAFRAAWAGGPYAGRETSARMSATHQGVAVPHLTVDYSAQLTDTFDGKALGRDLHRVIEKVVGAQVAGCKTVLRRIDQSVIADGDEDVDMVHVDVAIHAGRTPDAKAELASAALGVLKERLSARPGRRLHLSAHVSELDPATYVSCKLSAAA